MKRIVLAEDDREQRQLVAWFLRKEGYWVWEARDGLEALSLVDRLQPHLLLLDISMPGLDGWGVIERLRARAGATPPVIGMSGVREHLAVRSDVAVLAKPLDLLRLLGAVRAVAGEVAAPGLRSNGPFSPGPS